MPPFVKYLIRRLLAIPMTLLVITAALYGTIMLAPPAERANLYLPPRLPSARTPEQIEAFILVTIEEHGLNDPFPQQYVRWLSALVQGDWGWSPTLQADVLESLKRRTPATVELTMYAVLSFIPLGLFSGVMAGWREGTGHDHRFRFLAFLGTSIPPFILGLFLLSVFYVGLGWFPPGRTSIAALSLQSYGEFTRHTGLLTIDGLLNGRPDITANALRHLVLPVFSVSLLHWATLGRVTRSTMVEVRNQEYIAAARSRGIRPFSLMWRHAFRNALLPGLTSSALSAASLVTGVFIIEVIFSYNGLSELIVGSMRSAPDSSLALGFAVYSVLLVIPLMVVLDIVKALVDPRVRAGEVGQ
jgi:peptide/nickel transport system permease protein